MTWSAVIGVALLLLASAAAAWLKVNLHHSSPKQHRGYDLALLADENRVHLRVATWLFFASLVAGVFIFKTGRAAANDWRIAGLCFGTGTTAAAVYLAVIAHAVKRVPFVVMLAAFASDDGGPLWLTYALFGAGFVVLCLSALSLIAA